MEKDMASVIDNLEANVRTYVESLYQSSQRVPYYLLLHTITIALNNDYQREWQKSMRTQSFSGPVKEFVVGIMYSKGYTLEPETRNANGRVFIPRVRAREDGLPVFVKSK